MSNSEQPKMFDSRFIMTVLLIGFAWMGWQSYLAKKYPNAYKRPDATATQAESAKAQPTAATATSAQGQQSKSAVQNVQATPAAPTERLVAHDDESFNFNISSFGMALKSVRLKKYSDRNNEPIYFANESGTQLFSTKILGSSEVLNFSIEKTNSNEYVGTATTASGIKVTKTIKVDPAKYLVSTTVKAEGDSPLTGLTTESTEHADVQTGGFFKSRFDHQEFLVNHDGKVSRTTADASKPSEESYSNVLISAFGSQYFASATIDNSEVAPEFKAEVIAGNLALSILNYKKLNAAKSFELKYSNFVGPKNFELLKTISPEMTDIVNFGFFTAIAKGIFWIMKSIQSLVSNWGVALILLTLLVRALVLPVNIMSYKQMKVMAKIQPQIKSLRERYKDDAQKLNQEMLNLMKENKANPLGGCLPMLLQIPIFFALYQVIGQSIELYKAPFIFWIQDLSLKDPFYVLPVLMGVTMFVQQKITPSNMDPAQQKVMMFMPILFSFMMLSLPSGLTLYIFISSVFGVLQQVYFMREKNPQVIDVKYAQVAKK